MKKRVAIYTLGCKLNRFESDSLRNGFEKRDYQIVDWRDKAQVYVINTCTVTKRADEKCRKAINYITRNFPDSVIAVVGCYAQLNSLELSKIQNVDLILGSSEKFRIFDLLGKNLKGKSPLVLTSEHTSQFEAEETTGYSTNRTRAFLKIQDGCSFHCTYCIVPYTRGESRSRSQDSILRQAREIVNQGFKEIVLTGVNIGDYENGKGLLPLLKDLVKIESLKRLRLSSLEPNRIDDELIEFIAGEEIINKHLHIPIQSGDDDVLTRMGRSYSVKDCSVLLEKIADNIPDVGIGADFITGFPGEKDVNFNNTYDFIDTIPVAYLHVFSFSARKGTPAEKFQDHISGKLVKERTRKLIELGESKRKDFMNSHIGLRKHVLFEDMDSNNYYRGLTDNYIRVKAPGDNLHNEIREVVLKGINSKYMIGDPVV